MRASVVDASAGVIEVSVCSPSADGRARSYSRFDAGRGRPLDRDLSGLGSYPSLQRLAEGFRGFA